MFCINFPTLYTLYIVHSTCIAILTYLCLFACWERRPSTKERQFSVRGHPLHFSPGVSHLLCFFFRVSLPGVSWPNSSSLPWGVPCDGLTGDGVLWFPGCMSYPPPFLLYFIFYGYLFGPFPEYSVGYLVCPLRV